MPLPDIVTPTYELVVPSTKKKIKYRPFLVKEQKILIIAMESQDEVQILDAIKNILKNCINSRIKLDDLALFDIEYLFLQIRARSISEELKLNYSIKGMSFPYTLSIKDIDELLKDKKTEKNISHAMMYL